MSLAKVGIIGATATSDNPPTGGVGQKPRLCRILRRLTSTGMGWFMASSTIRRRLGALACCIGCAWHGSVFASDTLLVHGHIYTGDTHAPWATAIAVKGDRIE